MESRESRAAFQVVFVIAALLVVPAGLTLTHLGRFGYTWSLGLFLLPITGLVWWFVRRRDLKFPRAAFWRTIAVLVPIGFILDLLFGNAFFVFPNEDATIGCDVPAIGGGIPVEEFVFYVSGFILTLLSYVWCDEYWMAAYNIPDYRRAAAGVDRIVRFHFPSLILGVFVIGAAVIYRKWFSGTPDGFPWYLVYLTVFSLVPSAGFLKTARDFINWRAFGFTFFLLLLLSLLWEVTLALPYGWWGYRPSAMTGIYIGAWSGLPIEAVFVWLAVSFTTIIVYEVIKIWKALGRGAWSAFFGWTT